MAVESSRIQQIRRENQTCRIFFDDPEEGKQANGTGFLIGPDSILTNYHVFSAIKKQPNKVDIVFDFKFGRDDYSIKDPHVVKLRSDPKIASSPFEDDRGTPGENELDYAVLALIELSALKIREGGLSFQIKLQLNGKVNG